MSGVIINGTQWEHCNECGEWIKITELYYEKPTEQHQYGRDLCGDCAVTLYGHLNMEEAEKKLGLPWKTRIAVVKRSQYERN